MIVKMRAWRYTCSRRNSLDWIALARNLSDGFAVDGIIHFDADGTSFGSNI